MAGTTGLAIVTGTSSGIGAALAPALVARGWRVIGVARRDVSGPRGYEHLRLDLAYVEAVDAIGERLEAGMRELAGKPLALVNNAAVAGQRCTIREAAAGDADRNMTLNLTTPMLLMGLVHRLCPADSPLRVVNVSSGLASRPLPGGMEYCASKAGLVMASRVFETELDGRQSSGVLVYEPGIVDTEMQLALRSSDADRFPEVDLFRDMKDSGRLAAAEDVIAPMIDFLEARSTGLVSRRHDPDS